MKARPASLDQIERWMQSVITHCGGIEAAVASDAAREQIDVPIDELETVVERSGALSAIARLEIYVDAYFERLLECLREEFPVTRQAVGDELFDGLAFGYLQDYPSRSYTLAHLGANFPRFLDERQLHAHDAPEGGGASWPQFVVELARLERTLREVFDAPCAADDAGFDPRHLAAADASDLRLVVAPDVRLVELAHDVPGYWSAVKQGQQPPLPPERPCYALIHRRGYMVVQHQLDQPQFQLLTLILDGLSLGDAIARAVPFIANDGAIDDEVGRWFAEWAAGGIFCGATLRDGGA